ncbi:hypothetical protein JOC93_000597 [Priestia taiwanensis]|nr:hypothetical protein [Priestia taiwanensis]
MKREEMIEWLWLGCRYSKDYLQSLSDKELQQLYDRMMK